eukprot:Gb_31724 [translate_table: standard]
MLIECSTRKLVTITIFTVLIVYESYLTFTLIEQYEQLVKCVLSYYTGDFHVYNALLNNFQKSIIRMFAFHCKGSLVDKQLDSAQLVFSSIAYYKDKMNVKVPGGRDRDRTNEVLIVRDNGTSFKIIPADKQDDPDTVIEVMQWERYRGKLFAAVAEVELDS